MVIREALDGYNGGVQIGGRLLTNLRYADDIVLVACSEDELHELVNRLDRVSSRYNLMINIEKTKVMATANQQCNITIQGVNLEKVSTFPYLGSIISDDAMCSADIKSRLMLKFHWQGQWNLSIFEQAVEKSRNLSGNQSQTDEVACVVGS